MSKKRDSKLFIFLFIFLALVVRWAFFETYEISSQGMIPSLLPHDHILVSKYQYGIRIPFSEQWLLELGNPERGDVVVFKHPQDQNKIYIKRVVGLPGDRIFFENGNLYINDQLIEKNIPEIQSSGWGALTSTDLSGEIKENYSLWQEKLEQKKYPVIYRKNSAPTQSFGPYSVPLNHFFMLGDNRDNSHDSRNWEEKGSKAKGTVTFMLKSTNKEPIKVPTGTIVKTDQPGPWAQKFKTIREAVVSNLTQMDVEALEPGPLGNVEAQSIRFIESPLANVLQVKNDHPFKGGQDKRFIPRNYLIGRVHSVWLGCEKKLPIFTFLCHPFYLRWGRLGLEKI
ncbi:MAG: signal peptidase I [Bdellovibrionales bacterium]|nr:signal peptidase I [Bdellovibrionales bacterium]